MFDLIKAKYESPQVVEMQTPAAEEAQEANERLRRVWRQSKTNYPILALNLMLFICSLALVVYGAVHLNSCPIQKKIAIGYMTMGVLFCVSRLLNVHHEFLEAMGRPNLPQKSAVIIWLTFLIQITLLALFFATCYWVYSIEAYIKEEPDSPFYCQEEYYKSVFWGSTMALVAVALVFISACIILYYVRSMKRMLPAAYN